MNGILVGIDNGVTGSIGVIYPLGTTAFIQTPVKKCLSYTKEPQHIHRIDWREMVDNFPEGALVLIERAMVNPRAFKATQSAMRALEATLIVMEHVYAEYYYIDSKTWQREFISSAVLGHDEMKIASRDIAIELFPNHRSLIMKHGDGDGLLIAEYLRRHIDEYLK